MSKILGMSLSPVCLLIGLGAASAWGAAISEPPDFPDSGGPVITLTLGTTTIAGTVNGCFLVGCVGTDNQDQFTLNLPVGLNVVSAIVDVLNLNNGGGLDPQPVCFSLSIGCFGAPADATFALPPGMTSMTISSPWSQTADGTPITGGSDYLFTIQTTLDTQPHPTPEPSTYLLAAAGIATVLARRHFRKS